MPFTTHTISQASLSESNRSHTLRYLYQHGVTSRAQIARALNLTPAAISKITARLLENNIIEETQALPGSRNRRSVGLRLRHEAFHVIGVKFARSLLQIGVFDLRGTQISLNNLPTVSNHTVRQALNDVHRTIAALLRDDHCIIAIGMAVPGPYLREAGRAALVSSMDSWRQVNFVEEFTHSFPVPVFIEQDARAGALAEQLFSQHGSPSLAYYLLGEGVGLGVIDNGHLINGAMGTATELGHISIDVDGRHCECGNRGCLEQYCSAVAVHRTLNQRGYCPGIESMTHQQACERLFTDAQEGRADAVELVHTIGTYVGYGCVTIINAFNPSRIIVGDMLAAAGMPLLQAAQRVVKDRVIPELRAGTSIELSALPTDAAVSGAAAIAITQFLNQPSRFTPPERRATARAAPGMSAFEAQTLP